MFQRPHHQRIAQILLALDGPLLRRHHCYFGGGTAVALRHGEFRESVDIDFMVSDIDCYRRLRLLLNESRNSLVPLFRPEVTPQPWKPGSRVRIDQYGIRTTLPVADTPIKFEIILEGRIELKEPDQDDTICGIATLSVLDLTCTKLLANSDRWADDGIFSRDLIDLAVMQPSTSQLRQAVAKAARAYGNAVTRDLDKAIDKLQNREGWLERCMSALNINLPKALLWEKIRALKKKLPGKNRAAGDTNS